LAELYNSLDTQSFNLIGFVDDDRAKVGKRICGLRVLGSSAYLLTLIDVHHISDLVIAINGEIQGATFQSILDAQERGVEVTRMPILYEEMTGRVPVHHLESDWIIRSFVDGLHVSGFYELTKRLLDILGASVGLLIFAVTSPFLSIAVWADSGFPIFYSQPRLGKGGLIFKIYKYRSMRQDAEADGEAKTTLENDPRVTRVGGFLRRTRLDELPQFWNVLCGQMTLVGPRPPLPYEVEMYSSHEWLRLTGKPGLTGTWQVYGRSRVTFQSMVEMDIEYLENQSLWQDIKLIALTVPVMILARGGA
jgi:lipopolysaccharide/colanic/teichoic acid biosynthesis glycosyltransferase